jgi:FKBP-type peptidyl-prolyl cis-trans isomerase FkpA
MMLKSKILMIATVMIMSLSACNKLEDYDEEAQMQVDREIIEQYITEQKLTDVKESNGVFYQIIKPGTGTKDLQLVDTFVVNYEGRLLDGTLFDQSKQDPFKGPLNGVIEGWQLGLPLIKEGGQIRLLIPSPLAYTNKKIGPIPANSPLDFTVELVKVNKFVPKQL